MKRVYFFFRILLLITGIAGCATTSVSTDYDQSVDFLKLKTYGWASEQKPAGDPRFDDPNLDAAIKHSVEMELQAKGFQKSVAGQPDLLLKYYITVAQKREPLNDYYPPVFNPRSGVAGLNTYAAREIMAFDYEEGTFVLDMVNPSGVILWRGSLEGMLDPGATPSKRIERVPEAITKALKDFPPRKR